LNVSGDITVTANFVIHSILPPEAKAWGTLVGTLAAIIMGFILLMVILGLVLSEKVDVKQALAVALMGIVGIMITEILIIAMFS
jgi:hypothetical protein